MTYFDDDELAEEADLSLDLVDLLQSAERFQSRPRLPPIDDVEAGETLDGEAREEPADDEG